MKYNGKVVNTNNAKKAIVVKFRKNDANGWEDGQTGNYTGTGYLNKKFVHPAFQFFLPDHNQNMPQHSCMSNM